ncbi:hypothetical protein HK102_004149 [Quaeritorhiza haematococci]|nr:hypothetical protein HK102_004149 [Quaeritorhiza haematococci]
MHGRLRLQKDKAGVGGNRDGSWMDNERRKLQAYEYLCHVGEAKDWIEACIKESIAPIERLEEELRNGIELARLAKTFQPEVVKKIFEDRNRLQYRHSDNINYLFEAMRKVGLPEIFIFELTDLYEKKNIPKSTNVSAIFSHYLAKKGLAPNIKNLVGQLQFTGKSLAAFRYEQLDRTQQSLEEAGVPMPQFSDVGNALEKELKEPTEEEKRAKYLEDNMDRIIKCEAHVRRHAAQKKLAELRAEKRRQDDERRRLEEERLKKIVKSQALARMHLARKAYNDRLAYFKANEAAITKIQATWRMYQARKAYQQRLNEFKKMESAIVKLQALVRGKNQREAYLERKKHFQDHVNDIIKIQALWKAKRAERAYKSLSSLGDPAMKIVQDFIHLFDDSYNDFEEELDLEKLRQLIIKRIRENLQTEAEVNELDVKISLLVKNRVSLEEVVHLTSKKMRQALSENNLADNHNPFNLKGHDKETRAKLENYQQLFYLLQTQPQYLAKMMFSMSKISGGQVTKLVENVVLALYGYAQNTREEYLLLNLIKAAIKIEIDEISEIGEFWRSNPLFIKLVLHYTRGAKERKFLRDLLQPLVKQILGDSALDLEVDPISIYKALIREEESRTGEKSSRPYDVTPTVAAADPEVRKKQAEQINKLRDITNTFLTAIINELKKMPFGIRYIAMQMKDAMRKKFPGNDEEILKIVGNLIYYRYMNPAIVAPEAFDVIEANISPVQRKNLAEVAKILHQISVKKLFAADDSSLSAMNDFITTSSKKFMGFIREGIEIFQVHRNLVENLDDLTTDPNDPLKQILNDLGNPPPAPEGKAPDETEIALVLTNRFAKLEDENTLKIKQIMTETKKYILTIMKVQTSGRNLLDMLEAPVTQREELAYADVVAKEVDRQNAKKELVNSRSRGSKENVSLGSSTTLLTAGSTHNLAKAPEATNMTFSQLKRKTLENMAKLEAEGFVKKANAYQDMLNAIAKDMLTKHRRRSQRQRELESLRATLKNLEEKAAYLGDQKKSYHDYINACMAQLGNKKSKGKKTALPFTTQYYHMKEIQKSGKAPQFGSYKYTADALHKKGVLISIDDYSPKQYGQITLTISSDEPGVFRVEASFLGIKLPEKMELRLEELLQAQYNNVHMITLFDSAKVNVNLLIYLVNKK